MAPHTWNKWQTHVSGIPCAEFYVICKGAKLCLLRVDTWQCQSSPLPYCSESMPTPCFSTWEPSPPRFLGLKCWWSECFWQPSDLPVYFVWTAQSLGVRYSQALWLIQALKYHWGHCSSNLPTAIWLCVSSSKHPLLLSVISLTGEKGNNGLDYKNACIKSLWDFPKVLIAIAVFPPVDPKDYFLILLSFTQPMYSPMLLGLHLCTEGTRLCQSKFAVVTLLWLREGKKKCSL